MGKLADSEIRLHKAADDQPPLANDAAACDARLVEQVRHGARDAFGVLVRRYERKLQRVVQRIVRDPEQSRDLAQEAFLRVYRHIDRFDTSRRFGPWLFRVGVNLAVDWLRRNKPTARLDHIGSDGELTADVADPDPRPQIELSQEVHLVLEQIPLNYRTVLILRDLEGFSCSEVAAIEDRREATIRWRLSRAREMFRTIWERRQRNGASV